MLPSKFEYYLCKYGLDYHFCWDDQNRKTYLVKFEHPDQFQERIVHFTFDDQPAPHMFGYGFFSSDYHPLHRIVELANNDKNITKGMDFVFFVNKYDVLVAFGTRTKSVVLVEDQNLYNYFCERIFDMLEVMDRFRNFARTANV